MRRTVVVMAGLGVVAVIGAGALLWKDIAVQYHLYQLHRDPAYLGTVIQKPEGTLERNAVRLFLKCPAGARALLSTYLQLFERCSPAPATSLNDIEKGLLGFGPASRAGNDGFFWSCCQVSGEDRSQVHVYPEDGFAMAQVLEELLGQIAGQEITLPGYGSLCFSFLPKARAYKLYGGEEIAVPHDLRDPQPRAKLVCWIRRLPAGKAAAPLE